jgi:hypothetical protein
MYMGVLKQTSEMSSSTYSSNQNHTELKEEAHYTIENPEKPVQHFKHPSSWCWAT